MPLREIWADYESAWAETDPNKRSDALRRTLEGTFVYVDPNIRTEGHEQLSHYIGELQKNIPGMRVITKSFAEHHGSCLVNWTLEDGQNNAVAAGVTCGESAANGLLLKVAVFYGSPAS